MFHLDDRCTTMQELQSDVGRVDAADTEYRESWKLLRNRGDASQSLRPDSITRHSTVRRGLADSDRRPRYCVRL